MMAVIEEMTIETHRIAIKLWNQLRVVTIMMMNEKVIAMKIP